MVKKQIEWQNAEPLNTPSKIREYVDSCKDWLLSSNVEEEDEIELATQPIPVHVDSHVNNNIGLVTEHIYETNVFNCFVCKGERTVSSGKVVHANPFTRAQCMLVCETCESSRIR